MSSYAAAISARSADGSGSDPGRTFTWRMNLPVPSSRPAGSSSTAPLNSPTCLRSMWLEDCSSSPQKERKHHQTPHATSMSSTNGVQHARGETQRARGTDPQTLLAPDRSGQTAVRLRRGDRSCTGRRSCGLGHAGVVVQAPFRANHARTSLEKGGLEPHPATHPMMSVPKVSPRDVLIAMLLLQRGNPHTRRAFAALLQSPAEIRDGRLILASSRRR
jgi:hypothetical protein